jgi:hypothetical protein
MLVTADSAKRSSARMTSTFLVLDFMPPSPVVSLHAVFDKTRMSYLSSTLSSG